MAARKPKKKKDTSFATWKFDLENIVNADPRLGPACLKIVRAYLDWMASPETRPFLSIGHLRIATALTNNTIIKARRELESFGYFVPDGKTGSGAIMYRIVNAGRNLVLDHIAIARETLRELEADKKAAFRQKKNAASSNIEEDMSTSKSAQQTEERPFNFCSDSSAENEPNNVYNSVEAISIEEEEHLNKSPLDAYGSYLKAHHGDEANEPLPIPKDQTEADDMMAAICDGVDVHPSVRSRMMSMLKQGVLTPNLASGMIGKKKEVVA